MEDLVCLMAPRRYGSALFSCLVVAAASVDSSITFVSSGLASSFVASFVLSSIFPGRGGLLASDGTPHKALKMNYPLNWSNYTVLTCNIQFVFEYEWNTNRKEHSQRAHQCPLPHDIRCCASDAPSVSSTDDSCTTLTSSLFPSSARMRAGAPIAVIPTAIPDATKRARPPRLVESNVIDRMNAMTFANKQGKRERKRVQAPFKKRGERTKICVVAAKKLCAYCWLLEVIYPQSGIHRFTLARF